MIRKISADDKMDFIEMSKAFYNSEAVLHDVPQDYHLKAFDEMMRSEQYLEGYIICVEDKTAGYGIVTKAFVREVGGIQLFIDEIYIKPEYRSMGLGSEFLKFCESCGGPNVTRLRLEVEPDNTKALNLYRRFGFEKLPYLQMIKDI